MSTGSLRETENNSSNSASLKGKIQTLEDSIQHTQDDMNEQKKEVNSIRTERDALAEMLRLKTEEITSGLMTDIDKIEDELNKHYKSQKGDNNKLLMELNKLRDEKTELQKTLLGKILYFNSHL